MQVNDIRQQFINQLKNNEFVEDKSGVRLIEIAGAYFEADAPAIFGTPNEDYIKREIEWYNSQSLRVADFPGGAPEIWRQVASEQGRINSNYGWCIYSQENWRQYDNVFAELSKQSSSRRAVMIYTRPRMWHDYKIQGMSDFMCTNTVQYMIRNGKLDAYVNMRSNDAIFGYKNDRAWQLEVQNKLATQLNVEVGKLMWFATSLHIYERHWHLVV